MTLFEELKIATHEAHDRLEKKLDMLSPKMTITDYQKVLEKFWGVYVPLEEAVKNSEIAPKYEGRWKTAELKKDLLSFGFSEKQLSYLPVNPDFEGPYSLDELIGILYVMEGSTLGAMVLSKHFGLRFNLGSFNGMAFFSGYGQKTPLKWREWREFSEAFAEQKQLSRQTILLRANKTFTDLEKWMVAP